MLNFELMKGKARQSGLSLMEMTVVIAAVAVLASVGLPAVRMLINSFELQAGTRAMISASLASARAIAAKEQKYAGIRFQKAYHPDGPLKASQYMVFIIYDIDLRNSVQGNLGCRAVAGLEPIKLPDSIGVMDLRINDDESVNSDGEIQSDEDLIDTSAFSIIFSPSGKLVIHQLWVINREGKNDNSSKDDIFNTETNVQNGIAMFIQDEDGFTVGLEKESSRNSFIMYDRNKLEKVNADSRWSGYLQDLAGSKIYINPYTGTMMNH